MSITYTYDQIDESQGELTTNSISYERKYRVIASETAEEAGVIGYMNGRIAAAGLKNIGTAFCDSISAEAQDGSQNKIWEVTVRWKRQRKEQETNYPKQIPLVYEESFQTASERKHLAFARSEDVYTRSGYAGSNVFSMIGTHGEGVDVEVPV
ncbi:MAG: hypothetical protein IKE64_08480, partial [Thermoguttaceae bacterium]|nr:hypothetical protein [Thermoguttaceae bacterium]